MGEVTSQISISLDGYAAGVHQSLEHPLGVGGHRLHEWFIKTLPTRERPGGGDGEQSADATQPVAGGQSVDAELADRVLRGIGAFIMGRNMFGGGRGPWDESWRGWWGEEPPYRAPVFVLTHHAREPLVMSGGTVFHFVTDGIESALAQARAAAGDLDVGIAGGAQTVRSYLRAGLLDRLQLHITPVLLGAGERLLDDCGDPVLRPVEVVDSPQATHIQYRVVR